MTYWLSKSAERLREQINDAFGGERAFAVPGDAGGAQFGGEAVAQEVEFHGSESINPFGFPEEAGRALASAPGFSPVARALQAASRFNGCSLWGSSR